MNWTNGFFQDEPRKLIENRTSIAGNNAIFSVYDTFQQADAIELHANDPMYCGMISGKKVIHSEYGNSFQFLPGESLVLPPDHTIYIDFPDADMQNPTKCITVELPLFRIQQIVDRMNETLSKSKESGEWNYDSKSSVHFSNTTAINLIIQKLFLIFAEENSQKDLLVDINISELIVHMLQTESRAILLDNYQNHISSNGLANAIDFIHSNLNKNISIQELSEAACMSQASFYRYFKNEFGMKPVEYINRERVKKASKLLAYPSNNVTDVSYKSGFTSVSHFIKLFKEYMGITPKQYQLKKMQLHN